MVNYRRSSLGLLAVAASTEAYWRMSCSIIQTGRVDPIINPGKVAGHVHKVSGASNFGVTNTFSDLQSSSCTSCEIQDDKSAYWTPQLYYQHANGSFEIVPNGGTVVYYLGRGENRSNIEPFPPGFMMLSGDGALRANDTTTRTYGTAQYANRLVSDRVSFACLDSSGPMPEDNYMRHTSCDNGMRAQIQFQSCWNGGAYQADQSHVAYMSQIDNGICPPTHPRQLPHLFFEVIYGVNDIDKTKGGQFVFSNGDTTGFGFHADFMNGWDSTVLTSAIQQCINNDTIAGSIAACPPLAKSQTPYFSTNCPERPSIVNETVTGMLSQLPGCNNVTSGPARAPQGVCATQPAINANTNSGSSSMFNPAVGDKLGVWAYVGCAAELSNARTLSKYASASNSMTIDACTAACKTQGYPLAGLENSRECYCSDALATGASYTSASTCASTSKMVCAGNSTQWCGAPNLLTVWNDTSYVAPVTLVVGSTKIANNTGTYYGCWTEGSNGRALSSDSLVNGTGMTNEMCVAYCQKGGYAFAGTEYSQECYCGNTLGGTNTSDISQCSMKCKGDVLSYCGAGNRLSVWQVTQVKSSTPITAVGGTATYVGCYTDGGDGGRTLANASFAGSTVSIDSCAAFCRQNSYPLFGMEYSSECYCGFAPKPQATLVSDGDCRMPCAGNSSQICGAGNRLSLWNQTLAPALRVGTTNSKARVTTYLGCWTEGTKGKALAAAKTSDAAMTTDMCSTYCRGKGYIYMGVENGGDCYCSSSPPGNGSTRTAETECNSTCKGNKYQNCGASNRLNVYKVPSVTTTTTTTTAKATTTSVAAAQKNKVTTTTKANTTTTKPKSTTTTKPNTTTTKPKSTTTTKPTSTTKPATTAKKTTTSKKAKRTIAY